MTVKANSTIHSLLPTPGEDERFIVMTFSLDEYVDFQMPKSVFGTTDSYLGIGENFGTVNFL